MKRRSYVILKNVAIFLLASSLSACFVSPEPLTLKERYLVAKRNLHALNITSKVTHKELDYFYSLALGLKYNLDYRVKLVNSALQLEQLDLAKFAMFPALNTSGSLYTRSNNLATFSTTESGGTTDVVTSTPKTLRSSRIALSWNILDFGVSYVRAKQQADRYLIAEEEARKQIQQLTQDITRSYWEAYSAQELMKDTTQFRVILEEANKKLAEAVLDKTIPQENILHYQEALLQGERNLIQLRNKYTKAMYDLKHLLNLPLGWHYTLKAPPGAFSRAQNLKNLNFKKIDAISLVLRPELRGQGYQERIAENGVKVAILQALPGITLTPAYNYNSNKFLANRMWIDKSADVAWNLLNLASLPQAYASTRTQVQYEKLKSVALTLSVLTESRYSLYRYQSLWDEYQISKAQTKNANALYNLVKSRNEASLASTQQVVMAKMKAISTKMDEDLLLSDMSTALGELYLSVGFDILPYYASNEPIPVIARKIKKRFAINQTKDFYKYVDKTYNKLFRRRAHNAHQNA